MSLGASYPYQRSIVLLLGSFSICCPIQSTTYSCVFGICCGCGFVTCGGLYFWSISRLVRISGLDSWIIYSPNGIVVAWSTITHPWRQVGRVRHTGRSINRDRIQDFLLVDALHVSSHCNFPLRSKCSRPQFGIPFGLEPVHRGHAKRDWST